MPTSGSSTGSPASSPEPITLAQAKLHLRVDHDDEDDYIEALIVTAREYAEAFQRRKLMQGTLTQDLNEFPEGGGPIRLLYPPLISVTSITYLDEDGVQQTLPSANYRVVNDDIGATIEPEFDYSWPITRDVSNAVRVTYVAGYGASAASVPGTTKTAMLLLIAHWYENREAVVVGTIAAPAPLAVDTLLRVERAYEFH